MFLFLFLGGCESLGFQVTLSIRKPLKGLAIFEDQNTPSNCRFIHPSIEGSQLIIRERKKSLTWRMPPMKPSDRPEKKKKSIRNPILPTHRQLFCTQNGWRRGGRLTAILTVHVMVQPPRKTKTSFSSEKNSDVEMFSLPIQKHNRKPRKFLIQAKP